MNLEIDEDWLAYDEETLKYEDDDSWEYKLFSSHSTGVLSEYDSEDCIKQYLEVYIKDTIL